MTASAHDLANVQQIAVLREGLIGSGYRPTIYCLNQGCHAPICVTALECPDCGTPTRHHEPTSSSQPVSGTRGRLLALACTHGPLTAQQAARTLDIDENVALDALEHLCRLKQLTRTRQDGKRGRYARHEYRRPA